MLIGILFGIFAGFLLRGIYNSAFISKTELILFKEIEIYCLRLLIVTYEDYVYLKEKKMMMMHKMGVEENEIKMVKNVDDANIKKWQHTSISKFLLAIPPRYRGYVEYRDWRGAMAYLNKFIKNA